MSKINICKIESFVGGELLPAITVNFDCGHLMKEEAPQVTCDVLCTQARGVEPAKKVLVLSRKNQLYAGHPSQTESICNTMFLIRNKKTGKGKLVSSSSCQLMNCTHRKSSFENSTLDSESEIQRARGQLADTFGSKRLKRSAEMAKRLRATTANSSDVLEKTIEGMNNTLEEEKEVPNENSVVAQLLPPCNREASSVEDIYTMTQLFTRQEMEELKGIAEMYMSAGNVEDDPNFRVSMFFNVLGDSRTLSQVQLLVYANTLINFTHLNANELNNKSAGNVDKICNHSKLIAMKLLKGFSVSSGARRARTQALTDRAYCHAIVAILLACDYKFNVDWFFSSLKGFRRAKLNPLLRVVGLMPTKSPKDAPFTHILKLPLPVISLAVTKRSKK
ncbi:hypothetical protein GE061_002763 [Apolygus lucorum]|uniref:DNA-directed RNA polymerase I subunit RPA49 n=1 Tax=Apolygus lucorum TaxID=248454 RepID=A0A6A4J7B9_APOLU|nr:hypothetical protein GE061_002763 [Apolygus lucorum]